MGSLKHRTRSNGRGHRVTAGRSCLLASLLAAAFAIGLTAAAHAQGAVRSVHGDWQIRCDTPPGA